MRWFFMMLKIVFYIPLRVIFPCKIIGKAYLPKNKTYVTVTNHLSARDVIMLGLYLPGFRYFLAKKELGAKKSTRFWLKMLGAIYIDRQGLDLKGIKASIACLKKASLSIFPEGTRNQANENMQAVKGGAAMIAVKAGVDIYPVMIHRRTKAFRRNYMIVGEQITLPYKKEDRFNTDAMSVCTGLINDSMNHHKNVLDNLVTEGCWREYNNQVRKTQREIKKAHKAALKNKTIKAKVNRI